MELAIFGIRDGVLVKKILESYNSDYHVVCFVDNNNKFYNNVLEELPVVSVDDLCKLYRNGIDAVLIVTRVGYARHKIMKQLIKVGIENIGFVTPSTYLYRCYEMNNDSIVWLNGLKKPFLPYLELNIEDICNLNCKGCTHFSNLFHTPMSEEKAKHLIEDLEFIAQNVFVFQLRILGGEPLLSKYLSEFIVKVRNILPKTDISIVTNGILIPKLAGRNLLKDMRQNKVGFHISIYPPTQKMMSSIKKTLEDERIGYGYTKEPVIEFSKNLSLTKNNNPWISQKKCISKGCLFLRDGKLHKCPYEALIYKFFEYYQIKKVLSSGICIYDNNIEWQSLIDNLMGEPVELCKYCTENIETFEWNNAKEPLISDWIVQD